MSTEQITEDTTTAVVEETTEHEAQLYRPPTVSIIKNSTIGDVDETVRVEIHDSAVVDTPGAIISLVETALNALCGTAEKRPAVQNVEVKVSLPAGIAEQIQRNLVAMSRVGPEASSTADPEALEDRLRTLEEHDAECGEDHSEQISRLRDLILQARRDQEAAAAAERAASGSEPADTDPREANGTTPPEDTGPEADDLGDALQNDEVDVDPRDRGGY